MHQRPYQDKGWETIKVKNCNHGLNNNGDQLSGLTSQRETFNLFSEGKSYQDLPKGLAIGINYICHTKGK